MVLSKFQIKNWQEWFSFAQRVFVNNSWGVLSITSILRYMKKIRLIFRRPTILVPEKASKKDLECKKKNKRDRLITK